MNRLRALVMVLFSPHYLVYTRRGDTAWLHHKEMGLGDTMKVIEGAGEIEGDLIDQDNAVLDTYEILGG